MLRSCFLYPPRCSLVDENEAENPLSQLRPYRGEVIIQFGVMWNTSPLITTDREQREFYTVPTTNYSEIIDSYDEFPNIPRLLIVVEYYD